MTSFPFTAVESIIRLFMYHTCSPQGNLRKITQNYKKRQEILNAALENKYLAQKSVIEEHKTEKRDINKPFFINNYIKHNELNCVVKKQKLTE